MVDYSIAAIPTEYRGRIYRSRLEARWAAFFDRLGLAHEYEPFDLGAWSPDFLLTDIDTLVEVKPLNDFDADTWDKMVRAWRERAAGSSLFLTRVAPAVVGRIAYIGWLGTSHPDIIPSAAAIGWYGNDDLPGMLPDIVCELHGYLVSAGGEVVLPKEVNASNCHHFPMTYTDYTMEQWARASAEVQWRPDDGQT